MSDDKPLDPEQARFVAKVRRLMMVASGTTFLALAVVIGVIGYRVFRGEGSAARVVDVTAQLPRGTRIVSTAVSGDRLVITIEVNSTVEIRTFDAQNLRPIGRLRFTAEP
jgi:hypothetical protein